MWLIDLFTRFTGRIGRQSWWIGFLVLTVASVSVDYYIDPEAYSSNRAGPPPPHLGRALWSALLLLPSCAITLKRLNDRDQPAWVGYLFVALSLVSLPVIELGLADRALETGGAAGGALAVCGLFYLWILIDNGFLAGTPGPNRHGPDPLASDAAVAGGGDAVLSAGSGRSWGAWVRDGLVGILFLCIGLLW